MSGEGMTTISRSEVERLNRISCEAHGVLGMFDAVIENAVSYTREQLISVICVAHERLDVACWRDDSEVDNG